MRELVTECTQEETNKGRTLQDKHCAGTSGGEFLLLRLTTTIIREGGERSEGPDAQCNGNTRFILYTKQNTRHQNGKLNWGAKGTNWGPTTLVGYPQHHVHM